MTIKLWVLIKVIIREEPSSPPLYKDHIFIAFPDLTDKTAAVIYRPFEDYTVSWGLFKQI